MNCGAVCKELRIQFFILDLTIVKLSNLHRALKDSLEDLSLKFKEECSFVLDCSTQRSDSAQKVGPRKLSLFCG